MLLEEQLCFSLYAASHVLQRVYRPILSGFGLTYPQFLVLLVLWEQDGWGVSEIGARLGLDSATLTPLLKRMESAGLISRQRSAEDERRVEIFLTSRGSGLRDDVETATEPVRCAAATATSDTAALKALLDELVEELAAHPRL